MIPEDYVADLRCGSRSTGDWPSSRTSATSRRSAPSSSTASARCREEVEYLLQIVAIKALCRRANVEKIEVGPKGAVLAFRDNIFANPEGLVAFIRKHGGRARAPRHEGSVLRRVGAPERLKGAADILRRWSALRSRGRRRPSGPSP